MRGKDATSGRGRSRTKSEHRRLPLSRLISPRRFLQDCDHTIDDLVRACAQRKAFNRVLVWYPTATILAITLNAEKTVALAKRLRQLGPLLKDEQEQLSRVLISVLASAAAEPSRNDPRLSVEVQ